MQNIGFTPNLLAGKKLFAAGALFLASCSAWAADLHVGSSGGEYRTIEAALTAASPGDTVIVHSGTYNESMLKPKSGTGTGRHTVLKGADGEPMPVINAQGQFNVHKAALDLSGVSHVTVKGLEIRNGGVRSIYLGETAPAEDILIDGIRILDTNPNSPTGRYDGCCNPAAIFVGYHATVNNVTIQNSYFNNPFASAIKVDSRLGHSQNVTIKNNVFEENHIGVHVKWATNGQDRGIRIENNYFYDNDQQAIHNEQAYSIVRNNIIYHSDKGEIYIGENYLAQGMEVSHNTLVNTNITIRMGESLKIFDNIMLGGEVRDYNNKNNNTSNNFFSDPLFVDLAELDFALASNSPAKSGASDGSDFGASPSTVGINPNGPLLPPVNDNPGGGDTGGICPKPVTGGGSIIVSR